MISTAASGTCRSFAAVMMLAAASGPANALEAFQMVRSLQLVQDRIAGGDHAALPMQRKLLEMIDTRLANADPAEYDDRRNFEALLVYSMSGGNPETLKAVASRLDMDDSRKIVVNGLIDYLNGSTQRAMAWLRRVDDSSLPGDVVAFISLVRGSVTVGEDATAGLRLLDLARLLSPGTLVEEAALRRSLPASVGIHDADRFLRASSQYVRRFLRSPYAAQFADEFVDGVVALLGKVDLSGVQDVISGMTAEQSKVIYLRLARRAAIDGHPDLLAFASRLVEPDDGEDPEAADQRALLYSSIASVTSENVEDVLGRLTGIDRSKLSASDLRLLDAAQSVAARVVSRPVVDDGPKPETVEAEPAEEVARAGLRVIEIDENDPALLPEEPEIVALPEEAAPDTAPEFEDEMISDVRKRLDAVDAMLRETTQ